MKFNMHIKKHKEHVIQRLNLKRNIVKQNSLLFGFSNFYKIGGKKKKEKEQPPLKEKETKKEKKKKKK